MNKSRDLMLNDGDIITYELRWRISLLILMLKKLVWYLVNLEKKLDPQNKQVL